MKKIFTLGASVALTLLILFAQTKIFAADLSPNLILNPSVETVSTTSANLPASWNRGAYGIISSTFAYPVAGFDGTKAMQVSVSSRISGDAKWFPADVSAIAGGKYVFSHAYQSTATTSVIIRYTSTNGTLSYVSLADKLAPSAAWKQDSYTFTVPANIKSMTVFHVLNSVGKLLTDLYNLHTLDAIDTTPPITSVTSPLVNEVASGTKNFKAIASDNVGVQSVRFVIDNKAVGNILLTAPYNQNIDTTSLSNGLHNVVSVAKDEAGNIATSSVVSFTVSNIVIVPDTTPPFIAFITPSASSTVSGSVDVTASSSDNVGVTSIKFYVDEMQLNVGATSSLPQITWNTLLTLNGTHTLYAVAEDLAGNTATTSVYVNVLNEKVTPVNLISNPSLGTVGTDGLPVDWFKSSWGTNDAVFKYSASSSETAASGDIVITNYTDGDAKWYFKDVPINALNGYSYSDYYNSTVKTYVTVRYTISDGTFVYVDLPVAPAVSTWTKYSAAINPPNNAVSLTVFHHLSSVGSLSVDSFFLAQNSPDAGDPFAQGMVSLTFDDGWLSQYDNALPILKAANMKGVFAIITDEMMTSGNVIANPSLETADSSGNPNGWNFSKTGTNNATGTYPVSGHNSSKATKVTITNYTSGKAGWSFKDTPVIPDNDYTYTLDYMADAPTTFSVKFLLNDKTSLTQVLDTIPAASTWTKYTKSFYVPVKAVSLTISQTLASVGSLTIDNAGLERNQIYVDSSQVLEMQAAGSEIASHTKTHASLISTSLSTADMLDEINNSRNDLLSIGVHPVNSFMYPYGDYNDTVIQAVKNAGYLGARSTDRGFNTKASNKYALAMQQVDVGTTPSQVQAWVDAAMKNRIWLILMYHEIDSLGGSLSTTKQNLQTEVNYLKSKNTNVVTLSEGLAQMNP